MKQSVEYSNVIILNSLQGAAFILRGGMILRYVRCETCEIVQCVAHPLALSPEAK